MELSWLMKVTTQAETSASISGTVLVLSYSHINNSIRFSKFSKTGFDRLMNCLCKHRCTNACLEFYYCVEAFFCSLVKPGHKHRCTHACARFVGLNSLITTLLLHPFKIHYLSPIHTFDNIYTGCQIF